MTETNNSTTDSKAESSKPAAADKAKKKPKSRQSNGAHRGKKRQRKTRTYPAITESIKIDHAITRGAFDNLFDGFRSAFFHTTSTLGTFGLEDGANEVHEYIIAIIDGAQAEIEAETATIAAKIKKKGGPDQIPRSAPEPQMRNAEIPAFVVRKFLNLFPAADRLIDAIVCAENVGAISWQHRTKLLKTVPKYLRSPAGRFQSLATKLNARRSEKKKGMDQARKAMREALEAALDTHRQLPSVEEKRPLKEEKAASAG